MTTQTIDHQREEMHAASMGHELGCYEQAAEVILEDLAAQSYTYETGALDELIAGVTILDRIIDGMARGTVECRCEDEDDQ